MQPFFDPRQSLLTTSNPSEINKIIFGSEKSPDEEIRSIRKYFIFRANQPCFNLAQSVNLLQNLNVINELIQSYNDGCTGLLASKRVEKIDIESFTNTIETTSQKILTESRTNLCLWINKAALFLNETKSVVPASQGVIELKDQVKKLIEARVALLSSVNGIWNDGQLAIIDELGIIYDIALHQPFFPQSFIGLLSERRKALHALHKFDVDFSVILRSQSFDYFINTYKSRCTMADSNFLKSREKIEFSDKFDPLLQAFRLLEKFDLNRVLTRVEIDEVRNEMLQWRCSHPQDKLFKMVDTYLFAQVTLASWLFFEQESEIRLVPNSEVQMLDAFKPDAQFSDLNEKIATLSKSVKKKIEEKKRQQTIEWADIIVKAQTKTRDSLLKIPTGLEPVYGYDRTGFNTFLVALGNCETQKKLQVQKQAHELSVEQAKDFNKQYQKIKKNLVVGAVISRAEMDLLRSKVVGIFSSIMDTHVSNVDTENKVNVNAKLANLFRQLNDKKKELDEANSYKQLLDIKKIIAPLLTQVEECSSIVLLWKEFLILNRELRTLEKAIDPFADAFVLLEKQILPDKKPTLLRLLGATHPVVKEFVFKKETLLQARVSSKKDLPESSKESHISPPSPAEVPATVSQEVHQINGSWSQDE